MERGNPDVLGNLEINRGHTLFLELSTDVPRQATVSRVTLHHLTSRPHERPYSAREVTLIRGSISQHLSTSVSQITQVNDTANMLERRTGPH